MQESQGFYKVMERETSRVKSVAFLPKKPIVIVAQHNGVIQAYDYQLNLLVHEFKDHIGPVRSIVYHPLLNIFASGGDDIKIRIWDYHTKRIISIFEGHKDYVRSLDFHPHQPYLLSTSDDQTIRIWNFQSKKLLAALPGHTHYVMCGKFFLEDFIVSGSLDQTIRIWDYKNINSEKRGSILSLPAVHVKQILDGHDKGVNNISVCKNTFATVSDDKEVKIWEFDGSSVFEKEVLYHHHNIVSSVLISENHLISNGEDGVLAVYSFDRKTTKKFLLDSRFWCISGLKNLYCVGHDAGFYLFSLENTGRVLCYDDGVYYVKNKAVYFNNFKVEEKLFSAKKEILCLQRASCGYRKEDHLQSAFHRTGSISRDSLLIQYEKSFDLLVNGDVAFSREGIGLLYSDHIVVKRDFFLSAIGLNGDVLVDNVDFNYNQIFKAAGCLAATRNNILYLLSLKGYEVIGFKNINFDIKRVFACDDTIAVMNRNNLLLLDYSLNFISMIQELAPINSGFFSEGTFFYSTIRQVKFLNKDSGMLKSLDNSFVFHRDKDTIYYLGKDVESVTVDLTDFHFKNAVKSEESSTGNDVLIRDIIESGDLPGLAPLAFLVKNKRGDIALPYITDPRQKFELCLSNGKYRESLDICNELCDGALFRKLAEASLRDCSIDVAESCFLQLEDYQSLFMLYVCSKQEEKIRKLYIKAPDDIKIGMAKYLKDDDFVVSLLEGRTPCTKDKVDTHVIAGTRDGCEENASLEITNAEKQTEDVSGNEGPIYRKNLLLAKREEFTLSGLDWEDCHKEALKFTTEGKFNQALKLFRKILYSRVDDEPLRRRVGMYISGLSIEKKRRNNISDPQKNIEMALYFSSLDLEENHHTLALRNTMNVLFRNGNFKSAKKMARQLGGNVKEILEYDSEVDKFEVRGDVFCYDVLEFREGGKLCNVCYVHSLEGEICKCCEIGILK